MQLQEQLQEQSYNPSIARRDALRQRTIDSMQMISESSGQPEAECLRLALLNTGRTERNRSAQEDEGTEPVAQITLWNISLSKISLGPTRLESTLGILLRTGKSGSMALYTNDKSQDTLVRSVRVAQEIEIHSKPSFSVLNMLRADKTCSNEQAHLTFTLCAPQDELARPQHFGSSIEGS